MNITSTKNILNRFAQKRDSPVCRMLACAVPFDTSKDILYFKYQDIDQCLDPKIYRCVFIYQFGQAGKTIKWSDFEEKDFRNLAAQYF
jgi:hypothetical protein